MREQWTKAREKNRRKARFEIRERVATGKSSAAEVTNGLVLTTCDEGKENHDLQLIFEKIHSGDRAFFSLSRVHSFLGILSALIPTDILLKNLRTEQIGSRLGAEYSQRVQAYLNSMSSLSLLECTALIGRYHTLSAFLVGGINPCLRGNPHNDSHSSSVVDSEDKGDSSLQAVSAQVMRRFFHFFPLSLSSYIVVRLIAMRMHAALSRCSQDRDCFTCSICKLEVSRRFQLIYADEDGNASGCSCTFCEACFWKDILEHVDERKGTVVVCPCCSSDEKAAVAETNGPLGGENEIMSPQARAIESKKLFEELPVDSRALKQSGRKTRRVPELETLSSTWSEAVVLHLGLCQQVRTDKLFLHTEKNSVHFVRGALELGVWVDARNEYGQTPLYIAAWYGYRDIVELLLMHGANPFAESNGALTLDGVCRAHGHLECLEMISQFRRDHWSALAEPGHRDETIQVSKTLLDYNTDSGPMLTVLIDESVEHPGAGSYLISGWLEDVDPLMDLWSTLPVDTSSAKTAKKLDSCASRHYFCDSEGWLRDTLQQCIIQAFQDNNHSFCKDLEVTVLSHMRFLHYKNRGSSLAPHVDLCRIEPKSGKRSTHSFLFYLTTCETGGETVLLGGVSGEGRDVVLARVQPKIGHLLLFPHICPHEGAVVEDVPKLLIRGEVIIQRQQGKLVENNSW